MFFWLFLSIEENLSTRFGRSWSICLYLLISPPSPQYLPIGSDAAAAWWKEELFYAKHTAAASAEGSFLIKLQHLASLTYCNLQLIQEILDLDLKVSFAHMIYIFCTHCCCTHPVHDSVLRMIWRLPTGRKQQKYDCWLTHSLYFTTNSAPFLCNPHYFARKMN